ncbi:unnamed protein product [Didymodactylos carnosus]|nr:unnamed protein product [Didymodactylos carnosus]CAF4212897.1 unnamed protein product [Didymodactylos carnosus]
MHLFVYDYMQHDGFFILRLIHSNAGEQVCSDILTSLWKNFYRTDKENGTSITNVSKNKMTTHTSINRAEIDATTHSSRNGTNQTNNPQQRLGGFFNYSRTITNL